MINSDKRSAPHKLVLIIDDSSIDNFVNHKMIELNNFSEEVVSFTRASKALQYLSGINKNSSNNSNIPSIIFLDLNMPVMDGVEFLENFEGLSNEIKSNCKIVVLTSSINPKDIEITKSNKYVLTFLNKPLMKNNFDVIELLLNDRNTQLLKIPSRAV